MMLQLLQFMGGTAAPQELFGHPRGLYTLFMTELWERLSYYGSRALLVLFMTAALPQGGYAYSVKFATAIYGLYCSSVYLTPLLGGWLADRFLGQQRAIILGGLLIAAGNYCCIFLGAKPLFFTGLMLIALGTGLLKPNVSAIVGGLYPAADHRRDGAFSIFYMGINIGAFLGPLACGYFGQNPRFGWSWGFGVAGVGMTLGVVQFWLGRRNLHGVGRYPQARLLQQAAPAAPRPAISHATKVIFVAAFILLGGGILGPVSFYTSIAFLLGLGLLALGLFKNCDSREEWLRTGAILIFFVFCSFFWAAYEQAGSSMNLFADRNTRNSLFGYSIRSSWYQSINPIFIVLLAPAFSWLWLRLGQKDPSTPAKFALGLFFLSLGFLVLAVGAIFTTQGLVSPLWLVAAFFCHTAGELCLSPVGLSMVTKLAPARTVGFMMGIWFLSLALGNRLAGWIAGFYESLELWKLFGSICLFTCLAAILLAIFRKTVQRLMCGIR